MQKRQDEFRNALKHEKISSTLPISTFSVISLAQWYIIANLMP